MAGFWGEGCVRGAQPIEIYKSNMLTRIRTVNRVAFVHVRMCVCAVYCDCVCGCRYLHVWHYDNGTQIKAKGRGRSN